MEQILLLEDIPRRRHYHLLVRAVQVNRLHSEVLCRQANNFLDLLLVPVCRRPINGSPGLENLPVILDHLLPRTRIRSELMRGARARFLPKVAVKMETIANFRTI